MAERQLTLGEGVRAAVEALRHSMYLCMPGAVVAYYPSTQTADIQPMTNDVRVDVETGELIFEPWKPILQVPVAWPRMGGMTISGPLQKYNQVVLQAFDLDPTPWRAQGPSLNPVNPTDAARHGGNYWRCIPTDLTGPIGDAAATGTWLIIGKDGDPAQIRIAAGAIQLGNAGGDFVALASKVLTQLGNIVSAFNSHTHPTPQAVALGPGPSGTPTTTMPTPGTVASPLIGAQ